MTDPSWWMRRWHPFCCTTSGSRWEWTIYIQKQYANCSSYNKSSSSQVSVSNFWSLFGLQDNSQWLKDQCMRMGDAYIIVYSVTDKLSFEKASELRIQLRRARQSENIPIILVGNKSDLVRSREVSVDGELLGYWFYVEVNHCKWVTWFVLPYHHAPLACVSGHLRF